MDLSKPQVGASSSSSSTHSFKYDVFLNFRGPDTRNNFTGHLYRSLDQAGINTFIDNDLTRGEDITDELLKVIEGSRISIVVFSADYASSKCCLDELVKIIQCKESKQQIVYPIFYKVDSSVIKYQKDQVDEAIAHLCKYKDNLEKEESWKKALKQAASLYGWSISDKSHEANIIGEIVEMISTNITKSTLLHVAKCPVGIEPREKDIVKLLNVGQGNPHMVGIWGIGGIGKSTLARAVYNSIIHEFEHNCFLENVREQSSSSGGSSSSEGLVKLQNYFLSKIVNGKTSNEVKNVAEGITRLKEKLSQKRVLLVIDDVDCLDQLEALAGECNWFRPGSKIIITTRDTKLLNAHGVDFDSIYEVKELNDQDASKLFNLNAFKSDVCPKDFLEPATEVKHYAKGIPLVLEVLGSDLRSKKNKDEWNEAIEYYRRYPNQQIQRVLKRSYEALDYPMKEVFLHIACFFKGDVRSYVIDVLQSCDLNPMYGLRVLQEKALIKIKEYNRIWMHDLIEDMGKEIVRQESPYVIGQRSRLWLYEDVRAVLEEKRGTDKIKAIVLKGVWNSPKIQLNGGSFTDLTNLQIFIVDHCEMLSGENVDYLPNQLRVLDWSGDLLRSLPGYPYPRESGMLRKSGPCMTPLGLKLKEMRHSKSIKLCGCDDLTRIPDLSGLTCLKELKLSDCRDLVEVDPSVGRLDKLVKLEIRRCRKLQMFPKVINLKSLETLILSDCSDLEFFPEIEGDMKSLKYLYLSRTAIKELPCSVENLTGLEYLDLEGCYKLTNVPSSIFYGLQRLEGLRLVDCDNLVTFPTKSESLPPLVFSTNPTTLQVNLKHCLELKEISEFPREIDGLLVNGCESLERISKLSEILEGKDSKMFGELDLTRCDTLCDNLARAVISGVDVDEGLFHLANKRLSHLANKRTGGLMEELTSSPFSVEEAEEEEMEEAEEEEMEEAEEEEMEEAEEEEMEEAEEEEVEEELMKEKKAEAKLTALLTLFFACAKSEEFEVTFPASASIPDWFTCHQDVKWDENGKVINKEHEFCIEIPQNSNNKGLALCIQSNSDYLTHCVYINGINYINGIKFDEVFFMDDLDEKCACVWVHYIPFVTVKEWLSQSGISSPDMFRVMFRLEEKFSSIEMPFGASWGVHLIEDFIWKEKADDS